MPSKFFSFVFVFFRVLCLPFIFYISGVSVTVGLVADDLDTAVGEVDTVRSGGYLAIIVLSAFVIGVGVLILNLITETVRV